MKKMMTSSIILTSMITDLATRVTWFLIVISVFLVSMLYLFHIQLPLTTLVETQNCNMCFKLCSRVFFLAGVAILIQVAGLVISL